MSALDNLEAKAKEAIAFPITEPWGETAKTAAEHNLFYVKRTITRAEKSEDMEKVAARRTHYEKMMELIIRMNDESILEEKPLKELPMLANSTSYFLRKVQTPKTTEEKLVQAIFGTELTEAQIADITNYVTECTAYFSAVTDFSDETDALPEEALKRAKTLIHLRVLLIAMVCGHTSLRRVREYAQFAVSLKEAERHYWTMFNPDGTWDVSGAEVQLTDNRNFARLLDLHITAPEIMQWLYFGKEGERKEAFLAAAKEMKELDAGNGPLEIRHIESSKVVYDLFQFVHPYDDDGKEVMDVSVPDYVASFDDEEEAKLEGERYGKYEIRKSPEQEWFSIHTKEGKAVNGVLYPTRSRAMAVLYKMVRPEAWMHFMEMRGRA